MSTSFDAFILRKKHRNATNLLLHIRNFRLQFHFIKNSEKRQGHFYPCQIIYPAASSIFSIKIPYPRVGSFTKTWVTAPTIRPFWITGEPDTGDCH